MAAVEEFLVDLFWLDNALGGGWFFVTEKLLWEHPSEYRVQAAVNTL